MTLLRDILTELAKFLLLSSIQVINLSRFSFVDKPLSESGHLKNHMRTHCGEKQFVCRECSMSFSVAGNLRNHMRSHSGEKNFCKGCSKFISQAQHAVPGSHGGARAGVQAACTVDCVSVDKTRVSCGHV